MKNTFREIIRKLLKVNFFWLLCQPIVRLSEFLKYQRGFYARVEEINNRQIEDNKIKAILKEPIVKHGPFVGLKYPDYVACGSAIFPKILGCYEREIQDVIENACNKSYSEIIDIGAAEGYYAVGFALRKPNAKIFAFDIDNEAKMYCEKMAELNSASNQIFIESECTSDLLSNFKFTQKGLIICDCEGFEKQLFTTQSVKNLVNCDLIIETHDFMDITISKHIAEVFSNTHHVKVIESIDDNIKAKKYNYPETESLDLKTKRKIFAEGRPAIMEWYYLESKIVN